MYNSIIYILPIAILAIVGLRVATYYGVGAWMSQKNKG